MNVRISVRVDLAIEDNGGGGRVLSVVGRRCAQQSHHRKHPHRGEKNQNDDRGLAETAAANEPTKADKHKTQPLYYHAQVRKRAETCNRSRILRETRCIL